MCAEDLGSELGTPVSGESSSALEGGQSDDHVAKLEAQNQILWAKAKSALQLEEENTRLQSELLSVKNKMVSESGMRLRTRLSVVRIRGWNFWACSR